jgi:3-hydroxypropanoate dehydrogenase
LSLSKPPATKENHLMSTQESLSEATFTPDHAGQDALDLIFRNARTHSAWKQVLVSDDTLHQIYDLMKLGPTSANTTPLRIVFVKSDEAKARLLPTLAEFNVEKSRTASVVALFAYDTEFYEKLPKLMPYRDFRPFFVGNQELIEKTGLVNSSLQAAYFMLAARALGLDCGPMAGFDAEKLNAEFFPDGKWKINFVCNLGYGSGEGQMPRLPRLDFEEAALIL